MEWTKEAREKRAELLRQFRDNIDSDDIRVKEKIKQKLIENEFVIHVLNNKELEEADCQPEDYYGINILPYYIIEPTQTDVQNFICFEVDYDEIDFANNCVKNLMIKFIVLCEQKTIIDADTSLSRHDLLAALLMDQFNFTNYFGAKIRCISDTASIVDSSYSCRTLIFKQITDNNLVKTRNKIPMLANKEIHV
jgi:hypothetical protein